MTPPANVKRQPDQTRQQLLEAAFNEIHRNGFRAASLDAILGETKLTKGALYHHFHSKTELGYAVVDEIVRPFVEEHWKPILSAENGLDAAIDLCKKLSRERNEMAVSLGCPFNNLINEMSPVDEGFRERLNQILQEWREGVKSCIARGQQHGRVRKDVDAGAVAAFVIASIEGCVGVAKATHSREFLDAGFRGLIDYLEHLRPCPAGGANHNLTGN